MRHDCHDGLRRGSRQPDPRADRLRGRLHRAEDVRRHRLHDRRPHGGGGQRRGWPDDGCRVGLHEASARGLGYAERRFRPRVAAEGEEVSLSDADAYDLFMGRYSRPLAAPFADFAALPLDGRVLDVGCGPGALTAELARRAGPGRVTAVDPSQEFVAALRGRHPGVDLIRAAGIGDIVDSAVAVDVEHATFEDWWEPFTLGVAPSGAHVAGLEPDRRTALRELCRERLPEPPFVVSAKAWVARGAA